MQVKNDDDLHGGQRSSEVKSGKLCYLLPNFVGRAADANLGCLTFMEVKGQQRSNTVNNICTAYMIFGE